MPTYCVCGQDLDELDFDEPCPVCLQEKYYEEQERRARERKEEILLQSIGTPDYHNVVADLLVHRNTN